MLCCLYHTLAKLDSISQTMDILGISVAFAVLALRCLRNWRRQLRKRVSRANLEPAFRREGTQAALDNAGGRASREPDWRDLDVPYEFLIPAGKVDSTDTSIPRFLQRSDG